MLSKKDLEHLVLSAWQASHKVKAIVAKKEMYPSCMYLSMVGYAYDIRINIKLFASRLLIGFIAAYARDVYSSLI